MQYGRDNRWVRQKIIGRISGGVAMVLNQATVVLRVLEENIIEPVVQSRR